jgi:hypothetical protein
MKADPLVSEGARVERKAIRSYLRRQLKLGSLCSVEDILDWVLKREKRYDKRAGGLGK